MVVLYHEAPAIDVGMETFLIQSALIDIPFSMFAYLVSMSVSFLLAKVMGHLFGIRAVPKPYSLVSVCMMTGWVLS